MDLPNRRGYNMGPSFWYFNRDPIPADIFLSPERFVHERYLLGIGFSNIREITGPDLLSESTVLELIPPEGATVFDYTGRDYPAENGFTTRHSSGTPDFTSFSAVEIEYIPDGKLWYRYSTDDDGQIHGISAWVTGNLADGVWTLKRNQEEIAWFDVSGTGQYDSAGNFTIFVPLPKFSFDGSGHLSQVEIKFVYFDQALGAYRELDDYGILGQFIDYVRIEIREYNSSNVANSQYWMDQRKFARGRIILNDFDIAWKVRENAAASGSVIDGFGINYMTGAVTHAFTIDTNGD